ncbi:DUF3632 family protein [Rhizoctonia solani AG-3 Rhs1AP]|uniref:DUF3632 family protein n=2 Tax=Rhizoctonia solani AG-3 TaxID=1086053 RepID=A0A074RSG3_9AGAM|nr:DUF3632 family protein [Rhizoctonia solani AG-3 Rhs1AP]KEP49794.1 DUF3632 family protein [Rhizoctonia solani 123E]
MTDHEKMKSDVESTLDALISPARKVSSHEAAEKISTVGTGYIKTCAERPAKVTSAIAAAADEGEDEDEDELYHGPSTPGVPRFFSNLWGTTIERVHNAPVEEQAHTEHITRLVDLVGKLKENSQPEAQEWLIGGEKAPWDHLPLLGSTIRDAYNEPIDTMGLESSTLLSQEAQTTVAGAFQLESQHLSDESSQSDAIRLAKSRHRWLSLQAFISRLWRDCGCHDYALYALWALRSALEDWPESPPKFDAKCETFEESPAYLAFQVEAASIWICNTAPLMYKCTEIWGPKGKDNWPKNAGAPGRGGRRWDGEDGYDREHKRWKLWKDVLGEIVQWCDGAGNDQMQGWKVKDAATRALEAMKEAERQ